MRISDWSSDVCSSDLSRSASVFSVHMLALLGRRSEKSRKTAQLHSRLHISSRDRDRTKREANPVMCCRTAVFCRLDPPLWRSHGEVARSEEHTSELQSLMRLSYAVFCLQKNNQNKQP